MNPSGNNSGFYGGTCSSGCAQTLRVTEAFDNLIKALNDVSAWAIDMLKNR